jgi:CRISPR-associated endonuclease/helicase Cas3
MDFDTMVRTATGHRPYRWQARVAAEGLPDLVAVETGAGKTEGVVLPHLWRRRWHPDPAVRVATPRWLVLCLPLRVLVEQVEGSVRGWLDRLALTDEVPVHLALGGREDRSVTWRSEPTRDAVVIGTVDTLLSRALNRGYGTSRFSWPIDFGLLHNGTQWVFDEVQLLGPALATGRQLQGLRDRIGTALPTRSTWMSATVDRPSLLTVDNREVPATVELGEDDRADPALARRLTGRKRIEQLDVGPTDKRRAALLAEHLVARHRPGTLTLAVVNTVRTARAVHTAMSEQTGVPVTLLHSRFRPPDRRERTAEALGEVDPSGPGRIVVATQVVEAGVDVSAATLFTEAAPWPSIVQRAGRCNRDGLADDAVLLWAVVKDTLPYPAADVETARRALEGLEGELVTPSSLRAVSVPVSRPVHAVLRRADLYGLFDTAPDLSGNDIDISAFIRPDEEDLDLHIAWRALSGGPDDDEPAPVAEELCPVPAGKEVRRLAGERRLWRLDHLASGSGRWVLLRPEEVRPGLVVLAASAGGGYTPSGGWDPDAKAHVPPIAVAAAPAGLVDADEALGDDHLSVTPGSWFGLKEHLADVEHKVRRLWQGFGPTTLSTGQREAAAVAGRLHDVGKALPAFQTSLLRLAGNERERLQVGGPWAKSGERGRLRHAPPYLRHELASALALLGDGRVLLHGQSEAELVVYLVAAHHGRVRVGIRSIPEEERSGRTLGIADGDRLPETEVPGGWLPPCTLSLAAGVLGQGENGEPSWTKRALRLLHRDDLGPFCLGFLEAVVRLADWQASADPGGRA